MNNWYACEKLAGQHQAALEGEAARDAAARDAAARPGRGAAAKVGIRVLFATVIGGFGVAPGAAADAAARRVQIRLPRPTHLHLPHRHMPATR